jgi:hypothetical protein
MIYRPYANTNVTGNMSSNSGGAKPTPYPQTALTSAILSRLPYAYQLVQSMIANNPKFYSFKDQSSLRDDMLQDNSVLMHQRSDDNYSTGTPGSFAINKDYQTFVYASIDKDKKNRIMDYRRMAAYAEMADCLDEICDECIVKDDDGNVVDFVLKGSYSKTIQDEVKKEFDRFVEIYDLENTGWEKFRQMLIEGELFYENLIKEGKEEYGIIGLMSIPTELINPVFHNVQNELLKGFLLQKPIIGPTNSMSNEDQQELMFLQKAQVSYIHSGMWNEFKTFRLPFIENAKRAYRQLSLIEDSVVIYRLVRSPERMVFKVYTGNMPAPKAESYIKGLMMKYWSKKTYNGSQGQVSNMYDPQSMLDSYWFPVDAQGKGTDVSTLPSSNPLSEIKDLDYFLTKLYKSLKVPTARFMTAGDPFKDGAEITREELRFARFIMRLQAQFAAGIKETFITHLKLKGLWTDYKLKEHSLKVKFNEPTSFMTMRNQQLLSMKFENYNTATQSEAISKSYAQKYYLDMSADMMKENREWLRRDAALTWELAKITEMGPNFREQLAQQLGAEAGGGAEAEGMMGAGAGGGGSAPGGEAIPEFGGGEAPSEAGAEAGAEAGGPAAATTTPAGAGAGGAPATPSSPEV